MSKILARENISYLISIVILLSTNLIFIQLPLSNTLGYEFSILNALLLVFISGLYSISYVKKNKNDFKLFLIQLISLAFIPLAISIVYSIFTMFCSFIDGLLFYLLIAFPAVFVGSGISMIIIFYTKKFHKSFFVLIIILLAAVPVLEIYFFPQVYFYTPLIGYFPGNIYDEGLSPDWKLFFHQIALLIYFIPIIFLFFKQKELINKRKLLFGSILIVSPIIFYLLSPTFGFTTTYSNLEYSLSKKVVTANTTLHFNNLSESEAKFIALNQQYYFERLQKVLNVKPLKNIDVYLFDSREQKKKLFGAGNADVAKPWQYSIYISKDSWANTLQHELVHVFSAEFGSGIFKLASGFNSAMIEGLAEAVDNNVDNLSVMELTTLAFKNDYKIKITDLFEGLNFFKQNSSLSYTYSGSFFKYLIENYGIEKVKYFYGNGNFEYVFKVDLLTAQKNFETKLDSTDLIGSKSMADYYFGRLSIIQKVCPRFISDRLKKAWQYFNNSDLTEAEKLFNEINSKSLNYSALMGLTEIYLLKDKKQEAINLLNQNLNKFSNSPYYFILQLKLGDLYAQSNNLTLAENLYEKLIDENPSFYLTTIAKVRTELIKENLITNYIGATDSVKYNILLDLNRITYNYNSLISLIDLAGEIKVDYKTFLKNFNKVFILNTVESAFTTFKLSQFMLENFDYTGSRKMASLSIRYKEQNPFINTFQQNYEKANWFYYNGDKVLQTFKYIQQTD